VRQTLPAPIRRLPYRLTRRLGHSSMTQAFAHALELADPALSIAYFWPDPPTSLVMRAKGILTVREMINCDRGTAKRILDEAYRSHGLYSGHKISDESVQLELEQLQLYDFIFSPKQVEAGLLAAGISPDRIVPATFGWDPNRFDTTAPRRSDHLTALFVGTVCIRKGALDLLKAWKQSRIVGKLVLVGDVADEMRPFIAQFQNDQTIEFRGFTPFLANIYTSADFFVFPTFEEGSPQVVFEAAGCGLPIVTTLMGSGNLIKDGVNGLVAPAGNVEALSRAMSMIAATPEMRRAFSRKARAAAQNYTYRRIGAHRAFALRDMLLRGRASPPSALPDPQAAI
jgi:glycosyltransferase involved in cell wall biosynthesis